MRHVGIAKTIGASRDTARDAPPRSCRELHASLQVNRTEGRGRRPDPRSQTYAAFASVVVGAAAVAALGVVGAVIVASIGTTFPFPIHLADLPSLRSIQARGTPGCAQAVTHRVSIAVVY